MMDLVKPPTDNLYKFMAIAGLVLVVLGLVYAPWLFYRSTWTTLELAQAEGELSVHQKFADERQKTLNARKRQVEGEHEKLQKRMNELALQNPKNSDATDFSEVEKLETRIRETKAAAQALEDAEHELNLSLHLKQAQARYRRTVDVNERGNTRVIMYVGVFIAVIGIGISAIGFSLWYKRVTRFQDVIMVMQATSTTTAMASQPTEGSE